MSLGTKAIMSSGQVVYFSEEPSELMTKFSFQKWYPTCNRKWANSEQIQTMVLYDFEKECEVELSRRYT